MTGFAPLSRVMRWADKRLHRKFILILVAILSATSLVFLLLVIGIYQSQLVAAHARASMQVNRLLQVSLENAMLKRDVEGLREIVSDLGVQQGIAGVMILNPEFEVRFASDPLRLGQIHAGADIEAALSSKAPRTRFIDSSFNGELLRSVNPVRNQERCRGCHGSPSSNPVNGLVIVDYDAADIKMKAQRSALMLGGFGCFVTFAMGLAIWAGVRWLIVSRLQRLQASSQQLTEGNLDVQSKLAGQDEIAQLGASFDTMAARLGKSMADLKASGQFLQSVIDAIPDGVRVIDHDFTIVKANEAYCRHLGLKMSDVVGEKCYRSSHRRDDPCPVTLVRCPLVELQDSPSPTMKARHRHLHIDGGELFVEVSAARIGAGDDAKLGSAGIVESIRDFAEQAKISHEQRLSEIGLLATGVAHEIHNPLSSIQLALRAIQEDLEVGREGEFNTEFLEIVEIEIAKCLKVTDGLMMLSEPPEEEPQLVSINQVIPEVTSLLSYQASRARVDVDVNLPNGLRTIIADSDIRMIVVNLAQNAIHAMPEGGTLTIAGRRENGTIVLQFVDTGVGIPGSIAKKIFLPFWTRRADGSEGRGLGLSICKAIMERCGGSITVSSEVGKGTTFTLTFVDADAETLKQ